jgi:hypothetical protein
MQGPAILPVLVLREGRRQERGGGDAHNIYVFYNSAFSYMRHWLNVCVRLYCESFFQKYTSIHVSAALLTVPNLYTR